jgi:hypothetical protein
MTVGRGATFVIVAVAAAIWGPIAAAKDAGDACRKQIPASLVSALEKTFPGFDAPLVSDNDPDDVEYSLKHGGTGCLGVAPGDFDGDGRKDFALALTPRKGQGAIVVVALRARVGWSFKTIYSVDNRRRLYVETVSPGRYEDTGSSEDPKESGELDVLTCPHSGVVTGETEATGTVFCLVSGDWRKVVVMD